MLKALKHAGLPQAYPATHVAIDRWTGGAAEHFLYGILEPWGITWPAMRLSVDLGRMPDDQRPAALALLLLTLRDLAQQRIPIGFAGNRGMGAITVSTIRLSGASDGAFADFGTNPPSRDLPLTLESFRAPDDRTKDALQPLETAWAAYCGGAP